MLHIFFKNFRTSALARCHPSRVDLGPLCLKSYFRNHRSHSGKSGFVSSLLVSEEGREHLLGPLSQKWKCAELAASIP